MLHIPVWSEQVKYIGVVFGLLLIQRLTSNSAKKGDKIVPPTFKFLLRKKTNQ